MPRRRESFADLLILLPWPVSACLSAACWIAWLKFGPHFQFLQIFAIGFAFLSAFSAFRAWRTRRDLATRLTLESLATMDWKHFEDLMAEVFRREGYRVDESLNRGADGGIDLRLRREGETVVVQCKRWAVKKTVGAPTVHQTFGLQKAEGADRAIVVTTSHFTREARDFASAQAMELIDGPGLLQRLEAVRSQPSPDSPSPDPSSQPKPPQPPPPKPPCRPAQIAASRWSSAPPNVDRVPASNFGAARPFLAAAERGLSGQQAALSPEVRFSSFGRTGSSSDFHKQRPLITPFGRRAGGLSVPAAVAFPDAISWAARSA